MNAVRQLLKPHRQAGALNALLAPTRFLDAHCFLTKAGHVGVALRVRGIDPACLTPEMLRDYTHRIYMAMRSLDHQFRVYQYVLKHDGATIPTSGEYPSEEVRETVEVRRRFLETRGLYSVEIVWVLLFEAESFGKQSFAFSNRKVLKLLAGNVRRNCASLLAKSSALADELSDILAPKLLRKEQVFAFLRRLVNLDPDLAAAVPLVSDRGIDFRIVQEPVETDQGGIRVGRQHVEVLTLKDAPRLSQPNLFSKLYALPANFILCSEFRPIPRFQANEEIGKAQKYHHFAQWLRSPASLIQLAMSRGRRDDIVPDAAAASNVDELNDLSRALNAGDSLGEFSATLVFHGPDRSALQQVAAEAIAAFGEYEAVVFRETYNALNAYLSIIPGNGIFNKRRLWMLQSTAADMGLFFGPYAGEETNGLLGAEYLLALETPQHTPCLVNLECDGVLHALITGKTGAGKSTAANALLDHAQKYSPFTMILDAGGSYRQICRKHHGSYMNVGSLDFAINPFCIPLSKRSMRFLAEFVRMLLSNDGYHVTFEDGRNIFEAIEEIYTRPEDQRRLRNLKLSDHLWAPLYRWTGRGEYGSVFDNIEDEVTLEDFKVFDFQGIEELPEVAEPLFFYLFTRYDQVVTDPALATRLKILHCDEVWRFLEHSVARRQLVKAGKTYRKHLGALWLATQSAFDFKNAGLLEIINEVTPTKILLANPSADLKAYAEFFHLNARELDALRGLIPKRQWLLKKEERPAQIVELHLSPLELEQYRNDPIGNARRDAAIAEHGWSKGMRIAAGMTA